MTTSRLDETIERLAGRAAAAVVARSRLNVPALNALLARRLAATPGHPDSLFADPVFEAARIWKPAPLSIGALESDLLHPRLVAALDGAATERMPRDRRPFLHQLEAWQAARDGQSFLVTSGTGSGKTECFMIPILDDLLRDPARGQLAGVRAIVIYPLNALIESQRDRLAAWTAVLKDRLRFAMYNGTTPETARKVSIQPAEAELGDRRSIRETPPSILITNVTMLEYMLLRARDREILQRSRGLLRWIVLDEAHTYVGSQAAEMALLLRRVRAAFGVGAEQTRLIATSATISEGPETRQKLTQFVADLAGQSPGSVRVIEGHAVEAALPAAGADQPIEPNALQAAPGAELFLRLAPHPRVQRLKTAMTGGGVTLTEAGRHLFGGDGGSRRRDAQAVLDAAAMATDSADLPLLPWRAHVFQRALGGVWICIDPTCPHRDPELMASTSGWGFGAVWLRPRDTCLCRAPVFELVACNECGTPHLRARRVSGVSARLLPLVAVEGDEFSVDAEPDTTADQAPAGPLVHDEVLLRPERGTADDRFVQLDNGLVFDNVPPEDAKCVRLAIIEDAASRGCCDGAAEASLTPSRFGPAFFLGNEVPPLLEALATPLREPGLPMGGRRALSFSDSRQGTARLAAKLQQEAERTLTRAFLYHAVQEARGPEGEERAMLERRLQGFRSNPELFADDIRQIEGELAGGAKPIAWNDLVGRLAGHDELVSFACPVWRERARGGRDMAEEPSKLASMFLYRELFRRPRVQNNPETMGLLRLAFPRLEERARARLPAVLREAGVETDGWVGLALAAIDFGFRDHLAVDMHPDWLVRWAAPRGGQLQGVCSFGLAPDDRPERCRPWPGPRPQIGNPSRLLRLVYALLGGDWDDRVDQDRAGELLQELWRLITSTVARDIGRGAYRLDYKHAAVVRLDQGWLCPVTRRIVGYSPAGRSPYSPAREMKPIQLPRLPMANAGGLAANQRAAMHRWCESAPELAGLREQGLWTNLHDRVAEYAPFLRAQEHSAQIERAALTIYEERFREGRINILNCTTTMEMGVDIPNVSLVMNANVPPSIANYRQRVGRAGRRNEPFAFAFTFCRDLPWDEVAFTAPLHYLGATISAPSVRLDSPALGARHVHAALLGVFLRGRPEQFNVRTSAGAFFGATEDTDAPAEANPPVDGFIDWLRTDHAADSELTDQLLALIAGTALMDQHTNALAAETAEAMEELLAHWRLEYAELLARAAAAGEVEVNKALANRARRMRGEYLLGELARRCFIPAYGFPVDVVSFDHLSGRAGDGRDAGPVIAYGERRGGASRTLDTAIREYAPGAEVVVDGLVHRSDGVMPAWGAAADTSRLEDLQTFWECDACRSFGLNRTRPDACPACDTPAPRWHRTLRPAGFLGRRAPHTGYENLGHVPYQMPRIQAFRSPWRALPDPAMGRLRADPAGQVVTLSAGADGYGYALCLLCGRAEAETEEIANAAPTLPEAMRRHRPLARSDREKLVAGYCSAGAQNPAPIQRNVRLVHDTFTDVFELQLPAGATRPAGLALAAALREALTERVGTEAREIGVGVDTSAGSAGDHRVSVYLHDRAAGGAGLVTRLAEGDWFQACLAGAVQRLRCPQNCQHGCPSCVLRPDLNFPDERLDRAAGLDLAETLNTRLDLPESLRFFGPQSRILGQRLTDWLEGQRRAGGLSTGTVFLHGAPEDWELAAWPLAAVLARMRQAGMLPRLAIPKAALTDARLDLARKLDLHRLAAHAELTCMAQLPKVGAAPVLAVIESASGTIGIASQAASDAVPGPDWGLGANTPLVSGPAPLPPSMDILDSERLVTVSTGNATLIRLADRLDGPVAEFGSNFWKVIAVENPMFVEKIRTHGVSAVHYTDRYLLTPLNMRLLFEVLRAIPVKRLGQVVVETARQDGNERTGWAVFHPFIGDAQRHQVLEALLPGASVQIKPKNTMSHSRRLTLTLGDGRVLIGLLDQGFGAWRSKASVRHDFRADPLVQARALRAAQFVVQADGTSTVPLVLEEVSPQP